MSFRKSIKEPILFDTTIRENIKMGNLDVTDEAIESALHEANAYDFVANLPDQLDTHVGTFTDLNVVNQMETTEQLL